MGSGSSTRAVSITIGYVVLLVALLVIRVGRQHVGRVSPPAETPGVASQPVTPPIAPPSRTDQPAVIEAPKAEPSTRVAAAPNPAAPRMAPKKPAGAPPATMPAAPETTATTGDARTPPDVERAAALVPEPAVPATAVVPGSVGELVEPIAALPRPAAVPEAREISREEKIYEKESSALARVLGHYEQAYDRLDANGAAAIWPSVNAKALSRAFARLHSQDLDFGNCTFSVSASDAAARCDGVLRYARRIGDTALKTEQHVWTIEFARAGESWQIVKISAQ